MAASSEQIHLNETPAKSKTDAGNDQVVSTSPSETPQTKVSSTTHAATHTPSNSSPQPSTPLPLRINPHVVSTSESKDPHFATPSSSSSSSSLPPSTSTPPLTTVSSKHFKKMRLLGKGDVGNVFLVQATGISQLKGLFAMKVYKKSDVIERKKVNRVKLEREILQQTSHPFLVSMYAAFQTPSRLYVVLQYCQGGEFFRFLRKQPNQRISEEWARFYAAEVLCALEYLHFLGKQSNLTDGCKNTLPPHPAPHRPHTDIDTFSFFFLCPYPCTFCLFSLFSLSPFLLS